MGSQKCRSGGTSQSVLMMINPIIFTRTRSQLWQCDNGGVCRLQWIHTSEVLAKKQKAARKEARRREKKAAKKAAGGDLRGAIGGGATTSPGT
jgi:hypothetical protein